VANALTIMRGAQPQSSCAAVDKLNRESQEALREARMPNKQTEDFRFTDLSVITRSTLQAPSKDASADDVAAAVAGRVLTEDPADVITVVVRDGVLDAAASTLDGLPAGVFVGSFATAPEHDDGHAPLGELSRRLGGVLALINGATSQDAVCISVPAGVQLDRPVHIVYLSSGGQGGQMAASAPRVAVAVGAGASAEVVEDFGAPMPGGSSFTNAVLEAHLAEDASLKHGYVQMEAGGAAHVKGTFVRQAARSRYELTEACLGGDLARHDVGVTQAGEATETVMRHFVLAGPKQLHDVHSRLQLTHPEGIAEQLHKCIVSAASGRGVFDGNVKVERAAQRTDAKQLSRNLLLVPRATVNVKPNLQIVADDVKCTHGCTVSDLEDKQLFYFRSRGIDNDAARKMLVYSFGREVTQHLGYKKLQQRLQTAVNTALAAGFADTAADSGSIEA